MPIKVLLADDHELIRTTLSRMLTLDPEIEVIGVATGFAEAMDLCTKLRPDVIIMDLHMRDENSVTPAEVRSCFAQSRLLAISIWNDDEARALAGSFGAITLLDKAELATELIPAIKLSAKE
jgi:DNA-binding NarL/FixJ family response regulator